MSLHLSLESYLHNSNLQSIIILSAKSNSLADPQRGLRIRAGSTGGRFDRAASRNSRRRGKVNCVRKSTGKRLCFEVFKRDSFTCQYCGRRPPDVVLEVDHIDPVSNGGGNSELNLVTACEDCNGGKANKLLGDVRPSPDADLLYMETVQRSAEALRYLNARKDLEKIQAQIVDFMIDDWCKIFTYASIPERVEFENMIRDYSPEDIHQAMSAAGRKYNVRGSDLRMRSSIISYMWGCLRRMEIERTEK